MKKLVTIAAVSLGLTGCGHVINAVEESMEANAKAIHVCRENGLSLHAQQTVYKTAVSDLIAKSLGFPSDGQFKDPEDSVSAWLAKLEDRAKEAYRQAYEASDDALRADIEELVTSAEKIGKTGKNIRKTIKQQFQAFKVGYMNISFYGPSLVKAVVAVRSDISTIQFDLNKLSVQIGDLDEGVLALNEKNIERISELEGTSDPKEKDELKKLKIHNGLLSQSRKLLAKLKVTAAGSINIVDRVAAMYDAIRSGVGISEIYQAQKKDLEAERDRKIAELENAKFALENKIAALSETDKHVAEKEVVEFSTKIEKVKKAPVDFKKEINKLILAAIRYEAAKLTVGQLERGLYVIEGKLNQIDEKAWFAISVAHLFVTKGMRKAVTGAISKNYSDEPTAGSSDLNSNEKGLQNSVGSSLSVSNALPMDPSLAEFKKLLKDVEEEIAALETELEEDPGNEDLLAKLAKAKSDRDEIKLALKIAKRKIWLKPLATAACERVLADPENEDVTAARTDQLLNPVYLALIDVFAKKNNAERVEALAETKSKLMELHQKFTETANKIQKDGFIADEKLLTEDVSIKFWDSEKEIVLLEPGQLHSVNYFGDKGQVDSSLAKFNQQIAQAMAYVDSLDDPLAYNAAYFELEGAALSEEIKIPSLDAIRDAVKQHAESPLNN